ncbi:hypothetical protein L486_00134 [Kwoniella mangroviensis CBS 10435]|uniref:Uncharacterized protein n=2 Tax=Kwoniella mangrovensis TaxID=463800 RepID=A0A1B9IYA1_9TREE|nr:hypothetical protein L486_00134 [Kwoniella mangroviensis CBS 10435]
MSSNTIKFENHQVSNTGIKLNTELFFSLGEFEYFSSTHQPLYHLPKSSLLLNKEGFKPICVIWILIPDNGQIIESILKDTISSYLNEDDVLTKEWLKTILLIPSLQDSAQIIDIEIQDEALSYLLEEVGSTHLILDQSIQYHSDPLIISSISTSELKVKRAAGPYLVKQQMNTLGFYPVYRLYPDTSHAVVNGIYPLDGQGTYRTLNKTEDRGRTLVPVPSRLYSWGNAGKLKGYRLSVKDVFDIKGISTGAGSKVYLEMRGEVQETASCIRRLLEEGAVIVGKVKTNQFAVTGNSIEQSPDLLYPYSPRDDGYQSVSGTSSGSASSMASYDWLDMSVGSDTGAMGVLPVDGVLPLNGWCDTVGVLARDPGMMKWVLETWYSNSKLIKPHKTSPKIVQIPIDDFEMIPSSIRKLINNFISSLQNVLGMKIEWIDIKRTFERDGGLMSIPEFAKVGEELQYQKWSKTFIDTYKSQNQGRFPPVAYHIQEDWKSTEHYSFGELEAMREKWDNSARRFRNLIGSDDQSVTRTILPEPTNIDRLPLYRESKMNSHREPLSTRKNPISPTHPASIAGCPHYVVPIGQVPFKSLVSDQEEMQPLGMSIIGYPGSDFVLLEIIDKLNKARVLRTVKTGRTAF